MRGLRPPRRLLAAATAVAFAGALLFTVILWGHSALVAFGTGSVLLTIVALLAFAGALVDDWIRSLRASSRRRAARELEERHVQAWARGDRDVPPPSVQAGLVELEAEIRAELARRRRTRRRGGGGS